MLYGKLKQYRMLITFPSVSEAMKSERKLASASCEFVTIPTPRQLTAGCGLSLCISLENKDGLRKLLQEGICVDGIYEATESGYIEINLTKNDVS